MNIAIDGPAGAGKSTVARLVAKQLGFTYIDTGAMYRALTLAAMEKQLSLTDELPLLHLLEQIDIRLRLCPDGQHVYIGDRDVSAAIRYPEVSRQVSFVAQHPKIRTKMVDLQRKLANQGNVVMDGRDIGTNVLPDAEVKIFLTASIDERANRRYKELLEKGHSADFEELKQEIARRDKLDSERRASPLRCAEDAFVLDSTGLVIDQVVDQIVDLCHKQKAKIGE
jgi:CMP/dCMP kinase